MKSKECRRHLKSDKTCLRSTHCLFTSLKNYICVSVKSGGTNLSHNLCEGKKEKERKTIKNLKSNNVHSSSLMWQRITDDILIQQIAMLSKQLLLIFMRTITVIQDLRSYSAK